MIAAEFLFAYRAHHKLSWYHTHSQGKDDYEFGDISIEIDRRIKAEATALVGKEDYDLADLIIAIDDRTEERVKELTAKGLEQLSDIKAEIEKEREAWAQAKLEAAKDLKGRIASFLDDLLDD